MIIRNDIPIEWDTNDMREAASLLAGITKIEAENIIGTLLAKKQINKKRYGMKFDSLKIV